MKRFLYVIFFFGFLSLSQANNFYWIGGDGSFNDPAHWSNSSGGNSCFLIPSTNDNVYFTENSGNGLITVDISGTANCKDLFVAYGAVEVKFTGASTAHLNISGGLQFNQTTTFDFLGEVYFTSAVANNVIATQGKEIKGNLHFTGTGSWKPDMIFGESSMKVFQTNGTLILKQSAIKCHEFKATGGILSMDVCLIQAYNYFEIGSSVQLNVVKGAVQAPASHTGKLVMPSLVPPTLYVADIAMACTFPSNANAVYNTCSDPQAGVATITFTNTTCPLPLYAEWYNTSPGCGQSGSPIFTSAPFSTSPYIEDSLCCSSASYLVLIYDNTLNPFTSVSVSVTCPTAPFVVTTIISPTCHNDCDGQIRLFINGSNPPFCINYTPAQPFYPQCVIQRDTLLNVCSGTYVLDVSNNIGCTSTSTITVVNPSVITPAGSVTAPTCNNTCTGAAQVNPSGGNTGGYTYSWANPVGFSTSNSVSNLCPGSYTVTIDDPKGCDTFYVATIVNPSAFTFTTASVTPTCGDICNGTATISGFTGGTGPYNFSWAPVGTSSSATATSTTATGLCVGGSYTVTATDALGCDTTFTFNMTGPTVVVASVLTTSVSCNGGTNGSATGSAVGGTPTYSFSWLNGSGPFSAANPTVTNLSAGNYSLVTTDQNGCNDTIAFTIAEPTVLGVTLTSTPPSCNGICDATITTTVTGGTPNFTYSWTGGIVPPTTQNPTNVCAATTDYTVTVTDANSCTVTASINITEPPPIVITATQTNPSCNGACDGSVTITTSGGTPPISFVWADCGGCPNPRTGMCAGTYTVNATDGGACLQTFTFTLTQPNALSLTLSSTALSCSGACDAIISSVVSGGTPGYTYSWDGGAVTTPTYTNACVGTHTLIVTDANGCTISQTITISSPSPLSITINSTNPFCSTGCDGTANAVVTGGTPTITYQWMPGNLTTSAIGSLCGGTYTLTVTDGNGCTLTQNVTLTPPSALTLTTASVSPSCSGFCNGVVSVSASGGTPNPNYTYLWNNSSTNDSLTNQCAGNYNVTVTDGNGCQSSASITLTQPTALSVSISNIVPSCPNPCNGAALATGSGGTPPYTFSWSSGQTGANPTDLCVGAGVVTITDANGCTATANYTIPPSLVLNIVTSGQTLPCAGSCTGIASVSVTGTTNPVSYAWSPVSTSTTSVQTGLCAGTEIVTVTDLVTGCSRTDSVTFIDPAAITSSVVVNPTSCPNVCDGSATITPGGGSGSLTVNWLPGNLTTTTISNLCAGTYTATITDGNGCTKTDSAVVTQMNILDGTFVTTPPSTCSASDGCITVTPVGGTGPLYTYLWAGPAPAVGQTTATVCGLAAGNYSVTITDQNGCDTTLQIALNDPIGPTFTVTTTNTTCFGVCDGTGSIATTGTAPITITWPAPVSPAVSATASNLCDGTYNVSIVDGVGCTVFASVVITEPTQIVDNEILTSPSCGLCNGIIDANVTGGNGGFSYTWTPTGSGDPSSAMCAGTYTLVATDVVGCSSTFNYTLTASASPTLSFTSTNTSCFGACTGTAQATASGGGGSFTYAWAGPSGFSAVTANLVNLCAGVYTLTATDINGCAVVDSVTITEPTQLNNNFTSTNALCNGSCDGTATMTPTGGTAGYTFSWTPSNGALGTVSNLCAGSYTATTIDANGCTDTTHFTITEPTVLAISIVSTAPACAGACTGTAATTVTGGTSGYTYTWSPVVSITSNATNLCAAAYTVDVTDANGCIVTGNFNLVDPPTLLGGVTTTQPDCITACSGSVTSSPSGGTAGYTTTIFPGSSLTNLCPATYTVYVTDAASCVDSTVVTLVAPTPLTMVSSVSPSNCTTPCVGSISVSATTGTAPFQYLWTDPILSPSTNPNQTGLCAGIYTITVTDVNSCTGTLSIGVSDAGAADSATIVITAPSCPGVCDATANITQIFNGTAPFTYAWNVTPVVTTPNIDSLCAGNYLVTITDSNNCVFIPTVAITDPGTIDDVETITAATCGGLCDGAISINPTGGDGVYTYSWTGPSGFTSSSQNISNLCFGTYSLTITDGNLCTGTFTYVISNNSVINGTIFSAPASCNGVCDGTGLINSISGGTLPYSIAWTDPLGQTSLTATNLCAGNYSVTVTDGIGCTQTFSTTVTEPTAIVPGAVATDATCGLTNGQISLTPSGGMPGYTYLWSNGQTSATATGLGSGVYMVDITDATGCVSQQTLGVNNTGGPTITITPTNITCSNACNGSATAVASGSTSPYLINWVPGGTIGGTISNLCAGTYFVQAQDANNCVTTQSFTITQTTPVAANQTSVQPDCGACNGQLSISPSGGVGPFNVAWNGPSGFTSTSQNLTNLCAGSYTVDVTDAGTGCVTQQVIPLNNAGAQTLAVTTDSVDCNGGSTGSATVVISGGTPAFTTTWSAGTAAGTSVSNLSAGTYVVTVTDGGGCIATSNFTIEEPNVLALSLSTAVLPSCTGVCNGALTGIPSGGSLSYTYFWSTGASTSSISNLCSGPYDLLVTDANGCTAFQTTQLNNNPSLISGNPTITNPTCGLCDGSIALAPSGGLSPYTYVWNTTATTDSISNVCAGVYQVNITDANNCTTPVNVNVSNVNGPTVSLTATDETCFGICDGTATSNVSAGTAPYTYFWVVGGELTSNLSAQCPGSYTLQVQDASNCVTTTSVTINSASQILANASTTLPSCGNNDGAITLNPSGGTPPYTYNWLAPLSGSTSTQTNIPAGSYTVDITDGAGCTQQLVIPLSNPNTPLISVAADSATCNGLATGTATVTINGGTGPFTTVWSAGTAAGTSVSALSAGTYAVTVTDNASGCLSTLNFTIDEPDTLSLSLNSQQLPSCTNVCNGSLTAIPSGGTMPYTYSWTPGGSTASSISSLCAGTYMVVATDANGCTRSQNTTLINNPNLISGNPTVTNPNCGVCDGTIALAPSGGLSPYTFVWSTTATTSSITSVCAGVYQVNITDANNCTTPVNVNVSNTNGPTVDLDSTNVSCFGANDGTVTSTVSAGTGPYQYLWIVGGQTTTGISGQAAGSYTLQVQDANNCVTTASITINPASQIVANASTTQPTCGNNDGAIVLNPSGGTAPYTYSWAAPLAGGTNTQTNIGAGSYTVDVTDFNGCTQQVIVALSNSNAPVLNVATDSATCNGLATGTATVTISGGSGSFTTTWSAGTAAGTSVSALGAGNYGVTVTDITTGCIAAANFTIEEPDTLSLSMNAQQQPSCAAVCNGVLTGIPSGGTMPYSYLWSPGGLTSSSISNLCAGSYTVQVTDVNGCSRSQTTILSNNANLITSNPAITPPTCNQCDGAIVLNASGGNLPYTSVIWSQGIPSGATDVTGLCAGPASVQITDNLGCQQTLSFAISSATGPTVTVAQTDETCFATCDGTATITPSGGTAPYTFVWLSLSGTTNTQTNLCATGSPYFVETTDAQGCIFTSQITITSPNQMLVTPTVSAPSCGASDGAISLSISGGSTPYTFVWNPNVSVTSSASSLSAGNYTVDVIDANGCGQNFVFPLSSINSPTVTANVTNVQCGGACDGSVALTITGGNPAYTISWSDGSSNDTISNLCDTTISVTVTDASSCVSASTYTVTEPLPLQIALPNIENPLCNGNSNGTFSAIIFGGTLGYSYSWQPNPPATSTTFAATNLPAGAYTVTVTDANGCTVTQSDTLFDPPPLVLSGIVTDASCSTVPDGAIDLTVAGGTPGYTFAWSNAATTEDLANILVGNYTVVVTDTNACADSLTFSVSATVLVNAIVNNDTTLCEKDSIFLDGSASTGALTYEWSTGGVVIATTQTVSVLPPVGVTTMYIFIAANGACADTDTVIVSTIALPVIDAGPYTTILMLNSATIGGNPSAPAGSTISWSPGSTLSDSTIANPVASPTVTTTYTLTVTNANGCTSSDTVTVRVLPQIIFPNGFTPNGDGKNDVWIIDNISLFPECEVEVYNRWGERLFYSKGYTTPWDGNYKGKQLPVGTYYYAIKLNSDFFPEPFVGPITILR